MVSVTNGPLSQRDSRENPLSALGKSDVDLGHHPNWCPLVHGEIGGILRQLGDELDGSGAGTDDADSITCRVIGIVPCGGVNNSTVEFGDARDIGDVGLGQETRRGNEIPGVHGLAIAQRDPPKLGVLVPARALDDSAEPHVAAHVVLVGDVVGVLLDLAAGGEQS